MENTEKYFNMTVDELLEEGDERGYTVEECKLTYEGLGVHFCEDMEEYEKEKEDVIQWYKDHRELDFDKALLTINKRVAMLFV